MKKTLIYIIGAGRSGTTLLDIMFGNIKDGISLGEINRFYKRNGIPPKRDKTSKVFLFWNAYKNQLSITDFKALHKQSEQNEYHSAFFKSTLRNNDTEYVDALKKQYETLEFVTQERVLIESSKYPTRALNISTYLDKERFDIKYIYLKKDPVKVVRSFQKKNLEQPSKGFLMSNLYYLIVNILCQICVGILKRRKHKVGVVKYEDLVNNSEGTIKELSIALGEDCEELIKKLSKGEPLNTGYLFDGNRIRLKETLTLHSSTKKEKKTVKDNITRILNYIVYK
ncbi:sulfotransferase [Gaetbulibacter sp. PBL-D1]|uniref:sulfotransferase n=1 Tax=Gaetbulibacter sp. PBL-D1 TaxID=3422594 RepID=UPI003D2EDE1B